MDTLIAQRIIKRLFGQCLFLEITCNQQLQLFAAIAWLWLIGPIFSVTASYSLIKAERSLLKH